MKKLLFTVMTCLMLVGSVTPIVGNEKEVDVPEVIHSVSHTSNMVKRDNSFRRPSKKTFASELSEYIYDMYVYEDIDLVGWMLHEQKILYSAFESSDEAVASVTSEGFLTALKGGYTEISFIYDGAPESIEVFVSNVLLRTELGESNSINMVVGRKFFVNLNGLGTGSTTYTSSDTSILTVSATGWVTTKKLGMAYVIARCDGYADAMKVEVVKPRFYEDEVHALVGETWHMRTNLWDGPGKIEGWKSSNPDVAKIDSKGYIKALKPGTTTISVKSGSYTAKCKVIVQENTASYDVDMNIDLYNPDEIEIIQERIYYSGMVLKVDVYVFNNTNTKVSKLSNVDLAVEYNNPMYNEESYEYPYEGYVLLASQVFKEIELDLDAKSFKKITISFTSGTKFSGFWLQHCKDNIYFRY